MVRANHFFWRVCRWWSTDFKYFFVMWESKKLWKKFSFMFPHRDKKLLRGFLKLIGWKFHRVINWDKKKIQKKRIVIYHWTLFPILLWGPFFLGMRDITTQNLTTIWSEGKWMMHQSLILPTDPINF